METNVVPQNCDVSVEASNFVNCSNSCEGATNMIDTEGDIVLDDVVLNNIGPPPLLSPLALGPPRTRVSFSTNHWTTPDLTQIYPPSSAFKQSGGFCIGCRTAFPCTHKLSRYAQCQDECKCHPPASLNLGGEFLFGFPSVDCVNVALSFLPPEELARNQRISKQALLRFKKGFELCESYSTIYTWKTFDSDVFLDITGKVQHAWLVGKYCKRLKNVKINMSGFEYDGTISLFIEHIFRNNKQISILHLAGVPLRLLTTISSLGLPLRELTLQFLEVWTPVNSPFASNLLASCGHNLQVLNLGLTDVNLNLHDLIQSCPNLEVLGLPRNGTLDESSTTPNDRFSNLVELAVRDTMTFSGAVELIRRAPNLNKLFARSYDCSLVDMLKCFSGESLSLGLDDAYNKMFALVLKLLRADGVVLTHLRRFSTQRFISSPLCDNFVAVAPNVNVVLAESAGLKSMRAFHKGGLRITCLLLRECSKSVVNFLARKHVFPELKHVSREVGLLLVTKNKKKNVVEVPFRSHFSFRLNDGYGDCGRMMDCEEFDG